MLERAETLEVIGLSMFAPPLHSTCLARLQRRQVARTQGAEGWGGTGTLKPFTQRVMTPSSRSPWSFGVVLTQSALAVPRLRSDYTFASVRGLLHPASQDQR